MSTEAIDWHATLTQIKSTLEGSASNVGGVAITYFLGKLDVTTDFCPLVVIWAGDADFEVVQLGKDSSGRLAYREHKTIWITMAAYKRVAGAEDSIWANTHAQLEDMQKVILDALTEDTTIGGNVMRSQLESLTKEPPEGPEDEDLQVSRIELLVTKNWY